MKKITLALILLIPLANISNAQNVGINNPTPAASALLDLTATDRGLLIPRMSSAQRIAISLPAIGLLVYDVTLVQFYYFDGTIWRPLLDNKAGWSILGNSGTVDITNFIGTVDNVPFNIRVNNQKAGRIDHIKANAFFGYQSGNSLTTGFGNAALGHHTLFSNTSGYRNVAIGDSAMRLNTAGFSNIAIGFQTLYSNTTGYENTAIGVAALNNNTTGYDNIANGYFALLSNTTGYNNAACGFAALYNNTIGYSNTANGFASLYFNTTGNTNTAIGQSSLFQNSTGSQNTATGTSALSSNNSGWNNVANGVNALYSNTTGYSNSALGVNAGYVNTTGTRNTLLGDSADVTTNLTNATAIGWNAKVGQSNSIVLGSINGVNGATVTVNVGIGTTAPAQRLHVSGIDGVVRIGSLATGGNNITNPTALTDKLMYADANGDLRAIANGSNGQTLTINGSGVPTWSTPAGTGWSLTGNTATIAPTSVVGTPLNNNFIGTTDAKDFVLAANNKERMRFGSANYSCGIAELNPKYSLDIMISPDAIIPCMGYNGVRINSVGNSGQCDKGLILGFDYTSGINSNSGLLWNFSTAAGSCIKFGVGNQSVDEKMRLTANGLGILVSNPSTPLHICATNALRNGLMVSNPLTPLADGVLVGLDILTNSGKDALIWNYISNGEMKFGTNNTERMRITATGSVGIGTSIPARQLHIAGAFNTIRLEGVSSLGSFINAPTASSDRILFADVNGDFHAMPSGSAGQVLTIGAGAVPVWTNPSTAAWSITGNSGTVDGTNFIGTTDNIPFNIRVNNQKAGRIDHLKANVFWGYQAGNANTTGYGNVAMGQDALLNNTIGYWNVAIGDSVLRLNTTGYWNTSTGAKSLYSNTTGFYNVANGSRALYNNTTGQENTATGLESLFSNTTGNYNVANGASALSNNTTGSYNTANGYQSLSFNTTGNANSANGAYALSSNTTGINNTANGVSALSNNSTGHDNSSNGYQSLFLNSTGYFNVANGAGALYNNNTGYANSANGYQSLYSNTTGFSNVANGINALRSNSTGSNNVANGANALFNNNSGNANTADGFNSLFSNTTGFANSALGYEALYSHTTGSGSTAIGYQSLRLSTGINNTALGTYAGNLITTGTNNTAVGYNAQVPFATASNQIRMGDAFVTYAGIQVNWTATSDIRWKEQIRDIPYGLNFINKLHPVDYIRKITEENKNGFNIGTREAGFIAQEVESTLKEMGYETSGMISKDDKGYYGMRYDDLFSIMVKSVQELSAQNENLKNEAADMKNTINDLLIRIEKLEKQKQ